MQIIEEVTRAEMEMYRSVESGAGEETRRLVGMGNRDEEEGVIHWQRATSVHPHMMLGYPLGNDSSILKRYVAESMASLDELRARIEDVGTIKDRPADLPYSVDEIAQQIPPKAPGAAKEGSRPAHQGRLCGVQFQLQSGPLPFA